MKRTCRAALTGLILTAVIATTGCSVPRTMISGTQGTVSIENHSEVTLAVTRADFDELIKAVGDKDVIGIAQIQARDGSFNVSAGTRVLVLNGAIVSSVESSRVRVLDGPRAGASGWLFASEIHVL